MNILYKIFTKISEIFHNNYPLIMLCSCLSAILTAYMHYELKVNKSDLFHWKHITELCSRDMDYYQVVVIIGVILLNLLFITIILLVYLRPISESNELSLLEIKDRYVHFIMLRLIARLDKIQHKLINKRANGDSSNSLLLLRNYVRAHDNMHKAVALFRKDIRKVLAPSETEIMLPIEEVFYVAEEQERALRRAGYYKLPIEYSVDVMKSLLNPKQYIKDIE